MRNTNLDFFPEVFQAVPGKNFTVYAYMNDGNVRLYDMKPVIKQGGIFKVLENENIFREKLTVLNNSIAWDMSGDRDESKCIDIDPFSVFNSSVVDDFPEELFNSWDPDFTKLTPAEKKELDEAIADPETVPHNAINWD